MPKWHFELHFRRNVCIEDFKRKSYNNAERISGTHRKIREDHQADYGQPAGERDCKTGKWKKKWEMGGSIVCNLKLEERMQNFPESKEKLDGFRAFAYLNSDYPWTKPAYRFSGGTLQDV